MEAVEESETMPVGEWKTMRQGGDLGENGRGDGGGCPSLYDGTFRTCPWTRATPRPCTTLVLHVPMYTRPHSSELTVKGIDPTTTSVITCFEGFGQGSEEK